MDEEKLETSFDFETKMGKILNEMHNRGAITYDERENIVQLFLDYGFFRFREGFDDGLIN